MTILEVILQQSGFTPDMYTEGAVMFFTGMLMGVSVCLFAAVIYFWFKKNNVTQISTAANAQLRL